MTNEEKIKLKALDETFKKYMNAVTRATKLDTEDECMDKEPRKSTREAWAEVMRTEKAYLTVLKSLVE